MATSNPHTPVALLGGTFDPVHLGHLGLADDARRTLGVDEVRLMPAGDPPHRTAPGASGAHRMAMLRLATHKSDGKANLHQGAVGVGKRPFPPPPNPPPSAYRARSPSFRL